MFRYEDASAYPLTDSNGFVVRTKFKPTASFVEPFSDNFTYSSTCTVPGGSVKVGIGFQDRANKEHFTICVSFANLQGEIGELDGIRILAGSTDIASVVTQQTYDSNKPT